MKIAIIDDEQVFLDELRGRISTLCEHFNFECEIKCYDSPALIKDEDYLTKFEIILLDIDMPHINGIELADKINKHRHSQMIPYIIFVSAMDNLVFDALEQFPYSFVRKSHLEDLDKCIRNIHNMLMKSPVYSVKMGRTSKLIEIDKTMYLEKDGNYVNFYTTEGIYQERSLIDEKYRDLSQFGFIRPHIGAIANANFITEINSNYIKLKNGKEIAISRTYKKEVKDKYYKWLVRVK